MLEGGCGGDEVVEGGGELVEGDVVVEAGGTAKGDESGDGTVLAIYSVFESADDSLAKYISYIRIIHETFTKSS